MKLNNEEVEHLIHDQQADDPVEVESITEFHDEQEHLNYLSDVNLMNGTESVDDVLKHQGQ